MLILNFQLKASTNIVIRGKRSLAILSARLGTASNTLW